MGWRIAAVLALASAALIIWGSSDSEMRPAHLVTTESLAEEHFLVEVDGHIEPDSHSSENTAPWQTENLRPLLDYYLAYYEEGEQQMWQAFDAYCAPLPYCPALTELFERYLEYKTRLKGLDNERLTLASEFEDRLDKVNLLRSKLFSEYEISLLFQNEEEWDRQAIERLSINQDPSLSKQQKAFLVNQHLELLPEHMQQAVEPTQNLRKVHQILSGADFNSSDQYNQLSAEFGDDAAQRLVVVKQSQDSWLSKVRQFQQRKDKLGQQFTLDSEDYIQQLSQLKKQMFETNEQKRLQVYLSNPDLLRPRG